MNIEQIFDLLINRLENEIGNEPPNREAANAIRKIKKERENQIRIFKIAMQEGNFTYVDLDFSSLSLKSGDSDFYIKQI